MKQAAGKSLLKILLGIPCGILWWYGYSFAWVMAVPLVWTAVSGAGSKVRSKVKDMAFFLAITVVSYLLSAPLAFYLFIPKAGPGGVVGFVLAAGVVGGVALGDRKRENALWAMLWWRGFLAAVSAVLVILVLVPLFSGDEDSREKAIEWIHADVKEGAVVVMPVEADMDTEALHHRFHVSSIGLEQMNWRVIHALGAVWQELVVIAPHWRVIGTDPGVTRAVNRWTAITEGSVETARFKGNPIPANALYPARVKNPALGIYRPGKPGHWPDSIAMTVLRLWRETAKDPKQTSPELHSLGKRGVFKLDYQKRDNGVVLTISNREANEKGERIFQVGYIANKRGLNLPIRGGRYVHFIVEARVPSHLANTGNCIFIQDYNGVWERRSVPFHDGYWTTGIVFKRIRRGSSRLMLGVRFLPGSKKDRLQIKNVFICMENQ